MESLYASTLDPVKDGEIINGTVVRVENDYLLIDVGYKSEGFVSRREFPDGARSLSPGDKVEVYVEAREDEEGRMVLSKDKANRIKVWDEISRAYDNDENVNGRPTFNPTREAARSSRIEKVGKELRKMMPFLDWMPMVTRETIRADVFAGLTKKDLPRGHWRPLTTQEVVNLQMIK